MNGNNLMSEKKSDRKKTYKKVIGVSAVLAILAGIAGFMLWFNGAFLPSWIDWENVTFTVGEDPMEVVVSDKKITAVKGGEAVWQLDNNIKVQSAMPADIDRDGHDELLVLCWRIGRYGQRRPFWVKKDEFKWSQHIYIYDCTPDEGIIDAFKRRADEMNDPEMKRSILQEIEHI